MHLMLCNSEITFYIFVVISLLCFIFLVLFLLEKRAHRSSLFKKDKETQQLSIELQNVKNELRDINHSFDESLILSRELKTQLAFSRKMTELGKLVSGVAHELNNPISAIKASTETVIDIATKEISEMQKAKQIFQSLNGEELQLLINVISKNSQIASVMSYKERKEKRGYLKSVFEKYHFDYQDDDIDKFIDVGIDSPSEEDLKILSNRDSDIRNYILSIRNLGQHLVIIKIAVERAASLLLALKKFTRYTDKHEPKEFMLIDNIETVLSIYRYQMRGKISLSKTFLSDAVLFGYPEELFQVWTNLFLNAMQAMNHEGNISIKVNKSENNKIEICIIDNGPGIPLELQNKIFESDFSTKNIGEGSGMGLGITKSIIESHKGTISVSSEKGETIFKVTLPILNYVEYQN